MNQLSLRQSKIQEKRKHTSFKDFLMEIASWYTINLNKNNGKPSRYPETNRMGPIVSKHEYESLGDQMMSSEYNSNQSFFDQLFSLRKNFKHPNVLTFKANENSDFADVTFGAKNAYLSFTIGGNVENIMYSTISYINCTNILNCVQVTDNSQNIYSSKGVVKSFNVFYSKYIDNSSNIWFSSNLICCQFCINCDNLVNQSYCIDNKQLTKEAYEQQSQEILSHKGSYESYFNATNNTAYCYQSTGCSGNGISYSTNISNSHYVKKAKNGNNMLFIDGINHANNYYDVFEAGVDSDDFYAVSNAGTNSSHLYCSTQIESSNMLFYCYHMENCSFCLGCIGLKNKSYCILNKQYSKEERYEKVDEIFAQMEQEGTLGHFFPASMNPFYFNDTAAYLIDPSFTKEEVTAKGYLWRDEAIKVDIPSDAIVVSTNDLGNYEGYDEQGNRNINADILKCVIQDESGNYYRIIPMEYKFLVKHGLPLPRKHWLERMKENFRIL